MTEIRCCSAALLNKKTKYGGLKTVTGAEWRDTVVRKDRMLCADHVGGVFLFLVYAVAGENGKWILLYPKPTHGKGDVSMTEYL